MRILHRYLGFFLAGIMAMYSISGIVLIFRDTEFLKNENLYKEKISPNLTIEAVGKEIKIKNLVATESGDILTFKNGEYNKVTGEVNYTKKELPLMLDKMTHLHKAQTGDPLFFLNIFFGSGLLFLVISSFWMFMPQTKIFKKGLYFTVAGIVLTLILLFV